MYKDFSSSSFSGESAIVSNTSNILEISVRHNDYADEECVSTKTSQVENYGSLGAQYLNDDFVFVKSQTSDSSNNVVPVEDSLKRKSSYEDEEEEDENRTAPDEDTVRSPSSKRQKFSSEIDVNNKKWCKSENEKSLFEPEQDDACRFHNLTNVKERKRRHKAVNSSSSNSVFYDDFSSIDNNNDDKQLFHHHHVINQNK